MVNPFVYLPDQPTFGQIFIHDDLDVFGYRTTKPEDVQAMEIVVQNMANIYKVFRDSLLFDPILKAIKQLINDMNRNPANAEGMKFLLSKALEDYEQEVYRIRQRIPPHAGNGFR